MRRGIVRSSGERANPEQIANVLSRFVGQIEQVPPKFSAIKVAGERAYHLARSGQDVELTARGVEVHSLQIVDHPTPEQTTFETTCGKGTYVRALARDMGRALGVLGHIVALRRIRVGPFNETNAVDLSEIEALVGQGGAGGSSTPESAETFDRTLGEQGEKQKALLLPVAMALQSLPVFTVTSADAASLSLGKSIILRGRDAPIVDGVGYATCRDNVVALVRLEAGQLKPFRVFHTA